MSPSHQLSLALIWNRADIAKSEIFRDDRKWEVRILSFCCNDFILQPTAKAVGCFYNIKKCKHDGKLIIIID